MDNFKLEQFVDLERYPIDRPAAMEYAALLPKARAMMIASEERCRQ